MGAAVAVGTGVTESSSSTTSGHHMARQAGGGGGRGQVGGQRPRALSQHRLPTCPPRLRPLRPLPCARPIAPALTLRPQSHFACHRAVAGLGLLWDCWIQLPELPLELWMQARAQTTPTASHAHHNHAHYCHPTPPLLQDTATPPPSNHTSRIRTNPPLHLSLPPQVAPLCGGPPVCGASPRRRAPPCPSSQTSPQPGWSRGHGSPGAGLRCPAGAPLFCSLC